MAKHVSVICHCLSLNVVVLCELYELYNGGKVPECYRTSYCDRTLHFSERTSYIGLQAHNFTTIIVSCCCCTHVQQQETILVEELWVCNPMLL